MKKTLSILLVTATSLASLGLAHAQESTSGSGATVPNNAQQLPLKNLPTWAKGLGEGRGQFKAKLPIEFKVEKIDNGIVITKTSTDADVVTKLQERATEESKFESSHPNLKDVQVKVENIDNGVRTTLTSTDADTVTRLQERPAPGMRMHGGPMDQLMQNVQVTVEKVDNGVTIKRTSTDADTVKKLQEMEAKMSEQPPQEAIQDANRPARPQLADVQRTVTNLDNGVQVTLTSTNADTVTKLQEQKDKPFMKPFPGHRGPRGEKPMDKVTSQE